ncbi:MAG: 50S ribosomal protein L9 [Planctomyces sp.]|jgi:large subunit ribosomal protein L9|nr:50S ribosomal protein L9 [Planctomyces sp.]
MGRANVTASGMSRVSRQIELLLVENVESLGEQGEIIKVRPGYARNFLLPQGLATLATADNKRAVERHKKNIAELQAKRMSELQKLADSVAKYSVTLEANANEDGHLFGSILNHDISKALKSAGYAVEPDQVRLDGPLKELGMYTVKIHIYGDIKTDVKVWVVPAVKK